ncbi:MAG TPA: hypothetical protein EYG51_05150, partial [Pseudomonadales bacterium]|nr:hypothetical protein [Pseudomonadales bacterium]
MQRTLESSTSTAIVAVGQTKSNLSRPRASANPTKLGSTIAAAAATAAVAAASAAAACAVAAAAAASAASA